MPPASRLPVATDALRAETGVAPVAPAETGARAADADESLMLRFAAGDVGAFERIYDRHERPVYRFLLRSVRIPALADELLQEVWISVIRNAAAYKPQALFTTWLYRIARSRLVDHWRARDPEVLESLDEPAAAGCDATVMDLVPADPSVEPEIRVMERAQARAFVAAVEELPAPQREAFLLHVEAGLTHEQIAAITGAGAETVKSRIRYASAKLRAMMQPWRNDP
jgi:RNA polymerase sigma-70 factor (ECF subfamily)